MCAQVFDVSMFDHFKSKMKISGQTSHKSVAMKPFIFIYFQPNEILRHARHKSAQGCLLPPTAGPPRCAFIAPPAEAACDLEAELTPFMSLNQSQSCGVGRSQGSSDGKSFSKSRKDPQTR